jgi:3-deoxy-D-manno-octulosonic-acid transferase
VRFIYNILFLTFFVLTSPYYFWRMWRRGNWIAGFGERFAQYDTKLKQALTNRHALWLHAVSVGEVGICAHLIKLLEPRLPNVKLVVSTTTTTGMGELKRKLPPQVGKIYYPVDRRSYVSRAQSLVKPEAIVLVEAEIWPNFIWRAQQQRTPVFLVNARLSDRSYRGYKRFGFLFRPLFATFAGVGAQSEADIERLVELGFRREVIRVTGSMKFDAAQAANSKALNVPSLLWQAGAKVGAPVLVCGSTHDGEEALIGEMFLRLRAKFPEMFLVLVPRHSERTKDVIRDLNKCGVKHVLRTQLSGDLRDRLPSAEADCLVVDTTGELKHFYEHATVVFVGKSLTAQGGQNPIEPGALGKAMLFGSNMQNFSDVAKLFLQRDAAVQVPDAPAMEAALEDLFANPSRRDRLGKNAQSVVAENLGATDRTIEMILQSINNRGLYITPRK